MARHIQWTDDMVEELRLLYHQPISVSAIANTLRITKKQATWKIEQLIAAGYMVRREFTFARPTTGRSMRGVNRKLDDEAIAQLLNLWNNQKLSASQISEKTGMTRSAVIGQVNRLRLSGIAFEERSKGGSRPRSTYGPRKPRVLSGPPKPKRVKAPDEVEAPISIGKRHAFNLARAERQAEDGERYYNDPEVRKNRANAVLNATGCRWLDNDGHMCNAQQKSNSSYCAEHHSIVWISHQEHNARKEFMLPFWKTAKKLRYKV